MRDDAGMTLPQTTLPLPPEVPDALWRALRGQRAPAAIVVRHALQGITCVCVLPRTWITRARRLGASLVWQADACCLTLGGGRAFVLAPGTVVSPAGLCALVRQDTVPIVWVDADEQVVIARAHLTVHPSLRDQVLRAYDTAPV